MILEKKISWFQQCIFCYFVIISPWKRALPFIWTYLNPHHPIREAVFQVWLKMTQWFWRRFKTKFVNLFSLFRNYLPLEMGMVLHMKNCSPLINYLPLEKDVALWIPFTKGCFVPSFVGSWEDENVKSLRTDGRTDDEQQAIRKAHMSFQHRWAKTYSSILQPKHCPSTCTDDERRP